MGGKGSGGYRKNALPRDKNPAVQAKYPDPGVNSRTIAFMTACRKLKEPDMSDPEDIERHFYEYLGVCEEHAIAPMVGAYTASAGIKHQELTGVLNGDPHFRYVWKKYGLTPESVTTLQKSHQFLRISWETALMTDKGNPVKWIFLGKNYFGMKDQSEKVTYNVEVQQQLPSAEEVEGKYAAMVGRQEPKAELISAEDVEEDD